DAKDTIFSAVVGLVLVLGAYVLLNLINPNITTLKVPGLGLESVVSAADECTDAATPLVIDRKSCGDKGTFEKVVAGKEVESTCMYYTCPDQGDVCAQGTANDIDVDKDKWFCMEPIDRCQRVNDSNDGVLAGVYPELCSPLTIEGRGLCKWVDQDFSNLYFDGCIWYPALNCQTDQVRVGCDKCNDKSAECKPFSRNGGQYTAWLGVGVYVETTCLADIQTPVYRTWGSTTSDDKFQGICCENTDLSLQCWNGENMGDPKFP
ncbi:MAG: hypothetical protein ACNFW9_00005, partial [Candidatus Kerfeldbacteria bacterium]